jgi:hypothetical protein
MAFGDSAVIDNFNRANAGPPPSANWSRGCIQFGADTGLIVTSNTCERGSVSGSYRQGGYWNAATFGPDCEVFVTVTTVPAADAGGVWLYARLTTIGSGTTDGYAVGVERAGGSFNQWGLYRIDNAGATILGSAITQAVANGDGVGLEVVGSTLTAYHKPSAGEWTSLGTRTDSTYTGAGNFGMEHLATPPDIFVDNFAGGTVAAADAVLVVPPVRRVF